MFQRHRDRTFHDLSSELRDAHQWKPNNLRKLQFPSDITALAFDPLFGLLAIGTNEGFIHIFGKPGVYTVLPVQAHASVKSLLISASTCRLVCLDNSNQLSVWDLSSFGRPQVLATAKFDETKSEYLFIDSCIITSAMHTHVLLAMDSGEIRAYDLLCLRKSPYKISNLWDGYEKKVATTGLPNLRNNQLARTSVEIVAHPRDLNLLFVAYTGGIVLTDLTQSESLRVYEYIIPPGAPGGVGYEDPDILLPRCPSVTCIAVHPSGHYFAVGYTDGSIAFWAVEDEDQPLLVRTLDLTDVNRLNADELEKQLDQHKSKGRKPDSITREPIFKLSWSGFPNSSDPRGGRTVLTVLGGLYMTEPPCLTVYELPAFLLNDPPAPDTPNNSHDLHPCIRNAMRDALFPLKTFTYASQDTVQDYLLVPRSNPHWSGTFDPVAVILLVGQDRCARYLDAFQFPPSTFINLDVTTDETANQQVDPQSKLPSLLWIGTANLIGGHLMTVNRISYKTLVEDGGIDEPRLNLTGGVCFADGTKINDVKYAKYQPNRLFIAYNRDHTVQFYDVSAPLLASSTETLEYDFPRHLPDLTIDVSVVLADAHMAGLIPANLVCASAIRAVEFMPQSLECLVELQSGSLILFRPRQAVKSNVFSAKVCLEEGLLSLGHIHTCLGKQLTPYLMILPEEGQIEATSVTDIGVLAISYSGGKILVVDLRAPCVILRQNQPRQKKRHSIGLHRNADSCADPVVDLIWTVSAFDKERHMRLRLLMIFHSGRIEILTFIQDETAMKWALTGETTVTEGISDPLYHGTFILDSRTGAALTPDRESLCIGHDTLGSGAHCLLVSTGNKGAKVSADITGQRIARIDWNSKAGFVQVTQIIERIGSHVLAAFTDKHQVLIYSLPYLEYLHTLQLSPITSLPPTIDSSGDFLAFTPHPISGRLFEATYGTLFDFRRVYSSTDVDLIPPDLSVPPHPQPVPVGPSTILNTWFRFGQSMSGDQLDTLLAGPERPIPKLQAETQGGTSQAASITARAASMQSNLYNRLTSALNERGQLLDDLEQRFSALEEGSRSMVEQAKRLAAQQTAKSWFRF
ncbi:hypothetical protein AMATHDRAFT_140320 [Amanita thiersii Skay4041]|uniref:Lethal giant larvae (Lgl)-like C-terminal domain-containing protein n=1 Tax=Amanita thiersii Skay4041 TaxID=703135 RepID=A0A2A9NSC6_9AGAR|nr:hypothetical protein AMATHDRAFT_140320 [Amanita thiersii Skay4041]